MIPLFYKIIYLVFIICLQFTVIMILVTYKGVISLNYGPYRPRFSEHIALFMAGRNGFDRLCNALSVVYFILFILNLFLRTPIILALEYIIIAYLIFRVFSRNKYRRQYENMRYYQLESKVLGFFRAKSNRLRDRAHVYKKCPHCKKTLRLPRKRGKHTVNCPCCKENFKVRI